MLFLEIDQSTIRDLYRLLIDNLEDYSVDQRGDVGSWVRMACVSGLVSFSKVLLSNLDSRSSLEGYLPPETFHIAVGGILKQGVERLDNVRQLVGEELTRLASFTKALSEDFKPWRICGMEILDPLVSGSVWTSLI